MTRDLLLLASSLMIWGIGEGAFLYFQPLYLQQLGADPVYIGAVMGSYGAMMTIAHIPAGYLADRIGRRPLLWASWLMGCLATWVMALSNGLTGFVAGMLLYGLTYFVMSPLNSYATAARGKWPINRAILLISASFNLGIVVGPILGGFVGETYGLQKVFLMSAWFCLLATLIIFALRSQPVEHHTSTEKRLTFLGNNRYQLFLAAVFVAVFATYLPQPLSQNFLQNECGLSLASIGLLLSCFGLGVVLLSFIIGRLGARNGFIAAQAAVGLFALLLWKGASLPAFMLGYFLLGGYKIGRSLAAAQTRSLVPASVMGLAYGVTETFGSLATILAPPLAGLLYTHDPKLIYIVSFGLIGLSLFISWRFAPQPEKSIPAGLGAQADL